MGSIDVAVSIYLIGGLEHFYFPFHIWDVILPIDELIFFQDGHIAPPTRRVWYNCGAINTQQLAVFPAL